jgi:hypothetical protein
MRRFSNTEPIVCISVQRAGKTVFKMQGQQFGNGLALVWIHQKEKIVDGMIIMASDKSAYIDKTGKIIWGPSK